MAIVKFKSTATLQFKISVSIAEEKYRIWKYKLAIALNPEPVARLLIFPSLL